MNVMKQDTMDDKTIERCKTCEKTMHARGSRQIEKLSSSYRVEANFNGLNSYRAFIEQTKSFSMDREAAELDKKFFFSKRRKTHKKRLQSSKLLNQRSKQHFKLSKTSLNKKNAKHS